MIPTALALAASSAGPPHPSYFGWWLGYIIGGVVVVAVVAAVAAILALARSIGDEAPKINGNLGQAVRNTSALAGLRTTIEHATIIIGGLNRGRTRLGG